MSGAAGNGARRRIDILLHPAVIFSGIGLGVYLGLHQKAVAGMVAPYGKLFLTLLQMCVLPIMMAAVISSLGKMVRSKKGGGGIGTIFAVFFAGLLSVAAVGAVSALFFSPGSGLGMDQQEVLGHEIAMSEMDGDASGQEPPSASFADFLAGLVTPNVFKAASEGLILPILVFCLFIGFALGFMGEEKSEAAIALADSVYEAMLTVIGWIMYALPIGLCFIFASEVSKVGVDIFWAMLRLVGVVYGMAVFVFLAHFAVIYRKAGLPLAQVLRAVKEPIAIAFGTASSFAAIPSTLKNMGEGLRLNQSTVNLVVPLGISLNPQGSALHFAVSSIFIAQLYGVEMTSVKLLIVVLGAAFASVAAAGAPGIAALGMLSIILDPLGLPLSIAVVLLSAVEPVIDPMVTALNLQGNIAAGTVLAKRDEPE